jgi:hypothetical protein
MYSDDEYELTAEETAALAALPRETAPGELLEARVVRSLQARGYFGFPRARGGRSLDVMWKVAAAAVLFAGGIATGRYLTESEVRRSASITAPPSQRMENATPAGNSAPARNNETVVAELEMWL